MWKIVFGAALLLCLAAAGVQFTKSFQAMEDAKSIDGASDVEAEAEAGSHYEKGVDLTENKQYQQAVEQFSKAIELSDRVEKAYTYRGMSYGCLGEFEKGLSDFDKALALDPNLFEAYYHRAVLFGRQGKFARAVDDMTKVIELAPEFAFAHAVRASLYKEMGALEEAKEDMDTFKNLHPGVEAPDFDDIIHGRRPDFEPVR